MATGPEDVRDSGANILKYLYWHPRLVPGVLGFILGCSAFHVFTSHATLLHTGMPHRIRAHCRSMATSIDCKGCEANTLVTSVRHKMGRVVPPPTLGLLELVGDRTPLTRMPGAELESASWKPTATWYASQNLTFLFPKCSAPDLVG